MVEYSMNDYISNNHDDKYNISNDYDCKNSNMIMITTQLMIILKYDNIHDDDDYAADINDYGDNGDSDEHYDYFVKV